MSKRWNQGSNNNGNTEIPEFCNPAWRRTVGCVKRSRNVNMCIAFWCLIGNFFYCKSRKIHIFIFKTVSWGISRACHVALDGVARKPSISQWSLKKIPFPDRKLFGRFKQRVLVYTTRHGFTKFTLVAWSLGKWPILWIKGSEVSCYIFSLIQWMTTRTLLKKDFALTLSVYAVQWGSLKLFRQWLSPVVYITQLKTKALTSTIIFPISVISLWADTLEATSIVNTGRFIYARIFICVTLINICQGIVSNIPWENLRYCYSTLSWWKN